MVMKEDGTKWACESCIRGHRVSGCAHTDRELFHVPKKGRPVTQCHHCRQERKKRSAHVRCDCGETDKPHHPKEKCIHLRDAEERAKAGVHEENPAEKDPLHLSMVAEEQGCCCHHGGKCSCSIVKKETGEDVLPPHGPAVKPRLEQASSDGAITVFANGHHKPVHRKNHAAHEHGLPYKVPLPRSHTDEDTSRRNVDSLALDMPLQPSAFAPQTSAPFNTGRRKSKSEQPSPTMKPADRYDGNFNARPTPLDFSNLMQPISNQSMSSSASDNFAMSPLEGMSSATDGLFDPWSTLPSGDSANVPDNNPFGVWASENMSLGQPALTAASSGSLSEIDDPPPVDFDYGFGMPSIQENPGSYNGSVMMDPDSPQANRRSLPPGFFGNADLGMAQYGNEQTPQQRQHQTDPNTVGNKSPTPTSAFDGSWTGMIAPTSVPQRALGGHFKPGLRRASRSLGPSNAPNDELLRQLFPDINVDDTPHDAPTSNPYGRAGMSSPDKSMGQYQSNSATSTPLEAAPSMSSDGGFMSQSWSDGSLSMPDDTYSATPFDFDQQFTNSGLPTTWSQ